MSWFDRLPAIVQHALLFLLAALVMTGAEYVPDLNLPPYLLPIVTPIIGLAVTWATAVTRQYGLGKSKDNEPK